MRPSITVILVSLIITPVMSIAATAQPQDILEPVGTAIVDLEEHGPAEQSQLNGDVYQFEPLVVSEQMRREMAYRTMRLGLSRSWSGRFEDADKIVCRFYDNIRSRVRKHLQCATNRTFHFWAQESKRNLFGNSTLQAHREMAPYTVYHGPIYSVETTSEGKIRAMINGVAASETIKESETKLLNYARARAVGFARSSQGFENEQVVKFAVAYREINARDSNDLSDARAEAIIRNAGLDVVTYNRIAEAAETDEMLAAAISRAANLTL